ncbi:MAG: OsmC family protein [Anaerolineae bacterium]|nr:OsmC family protein [Anaerolineae bacterium]MDW8173203.1 OsmC family protein [Anaerolineae bacterium]
MGKLQEYLKRKAEAMAARRQSWIDQPESAHITIQASSTLAGVTGARPTRMGEALVVSDSAPGLAGHALGPTAPEMLLGALASCLVHTYVIQAVVMGLDLEAVRVDVEGRLDMRPAIGMQVSPPSPIQPIHYRAHLEVSGATQEQLQALHEAVEQTCPVLLTLRQPIQVSRQ